MRRRSRSAAAALGLALAGAACTVTVGGNGSAGAPAASSSAPGAASPSPSSPAPVPTGPGSAAAAMRALCVAPQVGSREPAAPGPTPPAIAQVEQEVETVRGLTYERRVAVDALTQAQIAARLTRSFDATYPAAFYARRTETWRTIGVIPPGADIRRALLAFQTGQVAGYYNPENGQLVYQGDTQLDLTDRYVLAHELTHAIDDQHFDLRRLDPLAAHCRDERSQAALGAVEGSAQYFATQVVIRFPGGNLGDVGSQPSLAGVPPFIVAMQLWPYTAGEAFVTALEQRGGTAAVNEALRHLPVSTEQVLHPDRFPGDLPQPVDVPDLSGRLGSGWKDLDVMQVGEEFLREMLRLRMDASVADDAAAGWGGGVYRAWSDGAHTAVVLATVWDTPGDARAFAVAAQQWLDVGGTPGAVVAQGASRVSMVFSDDPAALAALHRGL